MGNLMPKDISEAIELDRIELLAFYKRFIGEPLVICGCGGVGSALIPWCLDHNIEIAGICDNNVNIQGKKMLGHVVESVEALAYKYGNSANYITATLSAKTNFNRQLFRQLLGCGIKNINIFSRSFVENRSIFSNSYPFYYKRDEYSERSMIVRYSDDIDEVIGWLEDELSVKVYTKMISRRFHEYWYTIGEEYFVKEGYFYHDFFEYGPEEVLVQCGVFDGRTIKEFIEKCPNFKKIIGIEADGINFRRSVETIDNQRVEILHNAISDRAELLKFSEAGTSTAKISKNGKVEIMGIKGDDLCIIPTIIQMDIEGGELCALKGFENTIRKYKPKLAICLYHSIEDHWRIPKYIKSIVPEYKFHVRCDSMANNVQETVLFAHL